MMKSKKLLKNILGIIAVVFIIVMFFAVKNNVNQYTDTVTESSYNSSGYINFDDNELVYDGSGELNLMEGVYAEDGAGKNVTDSVNAVITAAGNKTRKIIRYSFNDVSGRLVSKKRTLVMKNYAGPVLSADDNIKLSAEELGDVINVLHNGGLLSAENGYGNDITSRVTCVREHISGQKYDMTFTVHNEFLDSVEITVKAQITGDVKNPVIKLTGDSVSIRRGEDFLPLEFIGSVSGGSIEDIKIESTVNMEVPGFYRVKYTMYSPDRTAKTTELLKVEVK